MNPRVAKILIDDRVRVIYELVAELAALDPSMGLMITLTPRRPKPKLAIVPDVAGPDDPDVGYR